MPLLYTTDTQTDAEGPTWFDLCEERDELRGELDTLRTQLTQHRRDDRALRERLDESSLRLSVYEDERRRLAQAEGTKDTLIRQMTQKLQDQTRKAREWKERAREAERMREEAVEEGERRVREVRQEGERVRGVGEKQVQEA
jgi:chromosome segregation ATPase